MLDDSEQTVERNTYSYDREAVKKTDCAALVDLGMGL